MELRKEFKKWWEGNGGKSQFESETDYRKQDKPCGHIPKKQMREWMREFRHIPCNIPLLKTLEKPISIDKLVKSYKKKEHCIINDIEELKEQGYNIHESNGIFKLEKSVIPENNIHEQNWNGEQVIKFGVVSDTHLCNKHQQLSFLNHLYDIFESENIDTVYHAGDLTDGFYKSRPEHIYELIPGLIGFDEQAQYIIQNYPLRNSITTKFITGNHDDTHIKNGGANIGKFIALNRKDMQYLGGLNATVNLTPNCTMELNHPLDGASYALSYSIQKYIDSMSGGEKPNILLNGHHHKALYLFYRNVHALECGTTCSQTSWMKGKRISAHIGGFKVEVHVDKQGTIKRFLPEFIPLYEVKQGDY